MQRSENSDASGIWTQIVRVEGNDADHFTITMTISTFKKETWQVTKVEQSINPYSDWCTRVDVCSKKSLHNLDLVREDEHRLDLRDKEKKKIPSCCTNLDTVGGPGGGEQQPKSDFVKNVKY